MTPNAADDFPFPYPVLTSTIESARGTAGSLCRVVARKGYTGTSEDGTRLELTQTGDLVQSTFILKDGRRIGLLAYDLTRVYASPVEGSQPDTFLAFASPGGRCPIGRTGDVRGGTSGTNIIGRDKAC